jgi:iron complex outermembrane receptor protein
LGYGITGQQDIPPAQGIDPNYAFLSIYTLSDLNAAYQLGNAYYQGYRPSGYNPFIKWEETATYNVGLDYGFWNNRITGSIDIYEKKTSRLLNNIPQPAGTNFAAFYLANVGDMTNKGVEFNIGSRVVESRNFTLDANFNITYNKNEITNLTVVPDDPHYTGFPSGGIAGGIGGQSSQINAVGSPKNTFYLYKQVYDSKSGLPLEGVFADINGDGIINQNDLYKGHPADPNVFLGFSTSATWKQWSAGFVLRGSFGNYIYNNTYSSTGTQNQILGNSQLYNASINYLTTRFKGNAQEQLSDYYLQNGSFLRMDNCNVGYNVGKVFHNTANLRLNLLAQNVFVITKYTGLDPEVRNGVDNNLYPRPRIISVGANLNF